MRRISHRYLQSLLGAIVAVSLAGPVWADAQADYARVWGSRETAAVTPKTRAELADALSRAAQDTALANVSKSDRSKSLWDISYGKRITAYNALGEEEKKKALFLCDKTVEVGAKQTEGFPAAAEALGMIQEIAPERRLECLTKLEKMYDICYRANPQRNLGMGRGLARVRLQIGQERWAQLRQRQIDKKLTMEELVKGLQEVTTVYRNAYGPVDDAIRALRPYVNQKPEYGAFIEKAEEIRKEIEAAQEEIVGPLQLATDFQRTMKQRSDMLERLKRNPKDTAAGDRLVRLNLNEFNDPAAAQAALPSASETTRQLWALAHRPLEKLSGADSLQLARWYEKLDDNPASRNRVTLLVRERLYFDAYLSKAEKAAAADRRSVELALKRVATDLTKQQITDEKTTELIAAVTASLKPAEVPPEQVAVVTPPKPHEGVKPVEPIKASDLIKPTEPAKGTGEVKPTEVKPVGTGGTSEPPVVVAKPVEPPATVVVDVPLLPPPAAPTEAQTEKRSSIFDFGREGL